jgi:hypothetical protein
MFQGNVSFVSKKKKSMFLQLHLTVHTINLSISSLQTPTTLQNSLTEIVEKFLKVFVINYPFKASVKMGINNKFFDKI